MIVGFGISSQRWAPQSTPRKPYKALTVHRRKARPSLDQPVELVVSANTKLADWKLGAAQARIVIMVTTIDVAEKYTGIS